MTNANPRITILGELNAAQHQAVETGARAIVVVAGPGTGKTKTLTARIAYLLASGHAAPTDVLALTFTKKAAEAMQTRVQTLTGKTAQPAITTFHGLCYELLGGNREFVSEPQRLQIIKALKRPLELKHLSTRELGLLISRAKNSLDPQDEPLAKLVAAYNQALHQEGLHDFDDLLLDAHAQLQQHGPSKMYKYVFVDEFQDTNHLQYQILKLLANDAHLFVIGDPNQSIYGFRGASGDIFGQFMADFPAAQQITLQVNYRSAPEIVRVGNAVFADNRNLQAHTTTNGTVRSVLVLNEYAEANWVIQEIQKAIGGGDFLRAVSDDDRTNHRRLSDFAVLYRSRAAAIALHKAFEQSGLPYQIVGDGSPYERAPVQDIIKLLDALQSGTQVALKAATATQIATLLAGLDKTQPPASLAQQIIHLFGFTSNHDTAQLTNLLLRFDHLPQALAYLHDIAEGQFYDANADAVTLLTIHAAKGLEFPRVFVVAAEQGILPHAKADQDEERRLFYVAVTRAKEHLDIVHTKFRAKQPTVLSQFVAGIDATILPREHDNNLGADERRVQKRKLKRSQQSLF